MNGVNMYDLAVDYLVVPVLRNGTFVSFHVVFVGVCSRCWRSRAFGVLPGSVTSVFALGRIARSM